MMALPERRMLERPPDSETWTRERREAWRVLFFEEQVALEARRRRHYEALTRALMVGAAVGLVSGVIVLFI